MTIKLNIQEGTYKIFNDSFYINSIKVLIKQRKDSIVTPNKTKNYIEGYFLDDKNKKQRVYISSLYPFDNNSYRFDYDRQLFNFVLNPDSSEVIIKKVS